MTRVRVYWENKASTEQRHRIQARFALSGMTVNGESWGDIKEEDMPLLEECARRGFLTIRERNTYMRNNNQTI